MDETLNDAPCGFLRFADDGTVLAANDSLLAMLGHGAGRRGEVEGRHVAALLPPGGRVFYQTHLFPLLRLHGRADEVYLSLRSAAGEEVPVLLNAVRREGKGHASAPTTNDCVLLPMRQRSRFEDEILRAKRAAEEATREKERALAALAEANNQLEEANIELEAQQEELQTQQEQLLEMNAHLHARAEREALLNRIGQALRAQGGADGVLHTAAEALGEALGVDRCYFAEYDIARDWARVGADWHRPGLASLLGTYRVSDFDIDLAEAYGPQGVLLSPDIQAADTAGGGSGTFSPKAAAALGALGMRSGVGIALFENGAPVASLNVAMADRPRAWTPEEVALVQEVAALTRSAADEARLREKEHRIAELLQAALQPPPPDRVAGMRVDAYYRAALDEASVGGDFYDVFPLADGCTALVVADLSGKGLQAASQVATVRHMLRAQLYGEGVTSAHAVTALNGMITRHELLPGFATLFVGAYDAHRRTLVYVNAGQEPGLLRRRAGAGAEEGAVEELGPTGPVLGGFAGAVFEERTVPLGSGDVIALFTDGLTEAGPNRKDQLGVSGMADILRDSTDAPAEGPREIAARVMRRVEATATPAGIRDDVSLLIACIE